MSFGNVLSHLGWANTTSGILTKKEKKQNHEVRVYYTVHQVFLNICNMWLCLWGRSINEQKLFTIKYSDPPPHSPSLIYTHMRVQPQTGPQPRAMYSSLLYSHFLTGKEEALALSNEKMTCGKDFALTHEISVGLTQTCYFNKPTVTRKRKIEIKQKKAFARCKRLYSLVCLPLWIIYVLYLFLFKIGAAKLKSLRLF